ncbi:hypothetical protein NUW54_g14343 [Trametes sanguinea]|uniref:Uncharacterized protein n=1 Tax=Trametes sanguinea TaxID=158606 RepID=A0ACC1ME98_9APHY|nr:hypothetical protein NUW54_g14343 [Trametes sanguinea]
MTTTPCSGWVTLWYAMKVDYTAQVDSKKDIQDKLSGWETGDRRIITRYKKTHRSDRLFKDDIPLSRCLLDFAGILTRSADRSQEARKSTTG